MKFEQIAPSSFIFTAVLLTSRTARLWWRMETTDSRLAISNIEVFPNIRQRGSVPHRGRYTTTFIRSLRHLSAERELFRKLRIAMRDAR
jgi:hypothetical protein